MDEKVNGDKDSSHEMVGLCDLVYKEIEKEFKTEIEQDKFEVKIIKTFFPIKRILKMIDEDRTHIFCGASKTLEREINYKFSDKAVYRVSNAMITHRDQKFVPQKIEDLVGKKFHIGAYYATASSQFLKNVQGLTVDDNYTSVELAFKMIESHNIDYFFYHDLGLKYLVRKTTYPIRLIMLPERSVEQFIMMNKNIPQKVADKINQIIEKLYQSKKINEIQAKYL